MKSHYNFYIIRNDEKYIFTIPEKKLKPKPKIKVANLNLDFLLFQEEYEYTHPIEGSFVIVFSEKCTNQQTFFSVYQFLEEKKDDQISYRFQGVTGFEEKIYTSFKEIYWAYY